MKVGEGGGFGWCGVEGWGENADNCNRITINFLKKETECSLSLRTSCLEDMLLQNLQIIEF